MLVACYPPRKVLSFDLDRSRDGSVESYEIGNSNMPNFIIIFIDFLHRISETGQQFERPFLDTPNLNFRLSAGDSVTGVFEKTIFFCKERKLPRKLICTICSARFKLMQRNESRSKQSSPKINSGCG